MHKIKIKNFGPIKKGFLENDGWFDIKKVSLFVGNQGSGKSTVAKLISTLMWVEKAIIRGDIKTPISRSDFQELIEFHRLEDYMQLDTQIEYKGRAFHLIVDPLSKEGLITAKKLGKSVTKLPKIMYVPAERNFLSSIANISKVSDLIIGSLKNFSVEFRDAQLASDRPTTLPINNTKVIYDSAMDENYLLFDDRRLKLSSASSGFHSIVPLYWVTEYLVNYLKQGEKNLLKLLSVDQTIRRQNELKVLTQKEVNAEALLKEEKKINQKYIPKYLVNIVEEPEQNLFPTSQRHLLNSLLSFNTRDNVLVMTTHSPYLLNYLTLSVEAHKLKPRVKTEELKSRLSKVVPLNATLEGKDLVVYQMEEGSGTITELSSYKGIPSDENYLNESLAETNELFSELLEIEDLCQ